MVGQPGRPGLLQARWGDPEIAAEGAAECLRTAVSGQSGGLGDRGFAIGDLAGGALQAQAAHRIGRRFANQELVHALEVERGQAGHGRQGRKIQFFVEMVVDIGGDAANPLAVINNAIWFHDTALTLR